MSKVFYNRQKIQAFDEFRRAYDQSILCSKLYPNDKGLVAFYKPFVEQTHNMGHGNFAVVEGISNIRLATCYWFANPTDENKDYLGAILCFRGPLKVDSYYTVLFILKDGTVIHDLRERTWSETGLKDMTEKLAFEFNAVFHPKTLQRQGKILRALEDAERGVPHFAAATGSREILTPNTSLPATSNADSVTDEDTPSAEEKFNEEVGTGWTLEAIKELTQSKQSVTLTPRGKGEVEVLVTKTDYSSGFERAQSIQEKLENFNVPPVRVRKIPTARLTPNKDEVETSGEGPKYMAGLVVSQEERITELEKRIVVLEDEVSRSVYKEQRMVSRMESLHMLLTAMC